MSASVDRLRPWKGDLPASWTATPLGYLVRTVGGSTPSKDEPAFWDGDIPWVTPKDMKRDVLSDSQDHVSEMATRSLRILQPPVVLTVVRGMILAHTVPVAITSAPVTINQDMKALIPGAEMSTGYLAWTLRAFQDGLLALVETAGHGTCKLSTELWRKFLVPVPPVGVQRAIADFLDRKTAAIDALIEKKERLIALLEEKRQALITQAVTKGLDPSVPMKDSGIEWLGEIPGHWGVAPLWSILRPVKDQGHAELTLLSAFREHGVVPKSSREDNHNRQGKDLSVYQRVEPNDVVVNKMKAWQGSVSVSTYQGIVSPDYLVLRPRGSTLAPAFAHYLLRSERSISEYKRLSYGVRPSQWRLMYDKLRTMPLVVPPPLEQEQILTHLGMSDESVRTQVTLLNRQAELLREYRQGLITAAVTGQLDIPVDPDTHTEATP